MPITELVKLCLYISLLYLLIHGRSGVKSIYVILKTNFPFIIYILGYSPIFSVTDDSEFDNLRYSEINSEKQNTIRFSIFSIGFGACKIYIFSWFNSEFYFYDILKINDSYRNEIENKNFKSEDIFIEYWKQIKHENITTYINEIQLDDKDEIEMNSHFYELQLDEVRERFEKGNSKLNTYITVFSIFAAVIAFFIDQSSKIVGFFPAISFKVLIVMLIYSIVNFFQLIMHGISIKKIARLYPDDDFGNFINTHKNILSIKLLLLNKTNFEVKSFETTVFISVIKNAEKYFKMLVLFLVLIWILNIFFAK